MNHLSKKPLSLQNKPLLLSPAQSQDMLKLFTDVVKGGPHDDVDQTIHTKKSVVRFAGKTFRFESTEHLEPTDWIMTLLQFADSDGKICDKERSLIQEFTSQYLGITSHQLEERYTHYFANKNDSGDFFSKYPLNFEERNIWYSTIVDVIVADGLFHTGEHEFLTLVSDAVGLAEETRLHAIGGALKYKQKELEAIKLKKEITDSIHYAKRIQEAILPQRSYIEKSFPEHLLIYEPKDIVSGDFYWMGYGENDPDLMFVANADCTGHGVPGAFMSMLGTSTLTDVIRDDKEIDPAVILGKLRTKVIDTLKQKGATGESQDGMDVALFSIHAKNNVLTYAGAKRPLYIFRKGKITKEDCSFLDLEEEKDGSLLDSTDYSLLALHPDRMPAGIDPDSAIPFTTKRFQLQKDDVIYSFSDGIQDQFKLKFGKKHAKENLKKILIDLQKYDMNKQQEILTSSLKEWKNIDGKFEQEDDILVFAMKVI